MPLADPRDIGREQAYGQSPSGPGPYAPQVQRPVRDLQPYAGPRSPVDMGYYLQSPSGPRGASMQPQQAPTGWLSQLQNMLQSATAAGIDPARLGLQGMFGQQQPRTIRTTDPGAGYGMSPSGPTTQQPARQPQMRRPQQNVTEQFSVPARYGQSPSNPNWQPRRPMSPFYTGPQPSPRPPITPRPSPIPPPPQARPMPPWMGP
jgi:hypothetical protein